MAFESAQPEVAIHAFAKRDYTKVDQAIAVVAVSIILATVPVILRFIFRRMTKNQWKWDDWLILAAMIVSNANASAFVYATKNGLGVHVYELEPTTIEEFLKILFVTEQFYGAAISFIKFSVLYFYRRVFSEGRKFFWATITLVTLAVAWWLTFALGTTFQCTPVQRSWDSRLAGSCINFLNLYIGLQAINIALDIAILILPLVALSRLQMTTVKKVSIGFIFVLGSFSIVIGIVRLAVLVKDKSETDLTYDTATGLWSLVEPPVQILSACLPTMTPIRRFFDRRFQSLHSRVTGAPSAFDTEKALDSQASATPGLQNTRQATTTTTTASLHKDGDDSSQNESIQGVRIHNDYNVSYGRAN